MSTDVNRTGGDRRRGRFEAGARLRGLTLVEVLAALVIIGGSVTVMLVAQSNSLEQLQACHKQLVARDVARELITGWRIQEEDVSVASSGSVIGLDNWSWRRTPQKHQVAVGVEAVEVTVEITYQDPRGVRAPWTRQYRWLIPDEAS